MLVLNAVSTALGGSPILNNISFSLEQGQRLSIIGPNGSGKTTLLKTIAGILPYEGMITYQGDPLKQKKARELARIFAMLGQKQHLHFNHTVYDLVMMGRFVHKTGIFHNNAVDKQVVMAMLEVVGLAQYAKSPINTLSGGQAQRVHLATVLAQEPQVVLLDELTNHLDIKHQVEMVRFLKHWGKEKILIGVFHDVNMALELSDNLLVLRAGQIMTHGNKAQVLPRLPEAYDFDIKTFMLKSLKNWEHLRG